MTDKPIIQAAYSPSMRAMLKRLGRCLDCGRRLSDIGEAARYGTICAPCYAARQQRYMATWKAKHPPAWETRHERQKQRRYARVVWRVLRANGVQS